jgi:isoleucyl-tRNA synthetase
MPEGLAAAEASGVTLLLHTEVTPDLRAEGWARDTVRHVQQLRKEIDLNIEDRIHLRYATEAAELAQAVETWRDYIMAETLALSMASDLGTGSEKAIEVGGAGLRIQIERA